MTLDELERSYKQALEGIDIPELIFGVCHQCGSRIILAKDKQQYCTHFEKYINELATNKE